MAAHRPRERRQPVRIGGRLRSERGWSDVVIRNVSARGVMGECDVPPARGDYVEVRCGSTVIVARVAWSACDRFGARSQDMIEVPDLIASATGRAPTGVERRLSPRAEHVAPSPVTLLERAAASTRFARTLDFLAIVLAGGALASFAATAAHDALARPLDTVAETLSTENPR